VDDTRQIIRTMHACLSLEGQEAVSTIEHLISPLPSLGLPTASRVLCNTGYLKASWLSNIYIQARFVAVYGLIVFAALEAMWRSSSLRLSFCYF
jgi:hypothetical protein